MRELNRHQRAIVRNAEWFVRRQRGDGYIDAAGDEFYGIRGDATLVGHSVTVRLYAHRLTGEARFLTTARRSLEWLAERQDPAGGWGRYSAFTLDGAQCVFEGFNTYRQLTGDARFDATLIRAADRMIHGTLDDDGRLRLPNVIEIGEYAHFAMLAYKTTGEPRFRWAGEIIGRHIVRNFDEAEGFWYPYDRERVDGSGTRLLRRTLGPPLRSAIRTLPVRGWAAARLAAHLLPIVRGAVRPQYALSLMDAELLLDTLDGSCEFAELRSQAARAVHWAAQHCPGPFRGTLVESPPASRREQVYPLRILNDSQMAATWPTACLLLAYCGLKDSALRRRATETADWLSSIQDAEGGFFNFQKPDGSLVALQSGNVNFYASLALWVFEEVYGDGPRLFTRGDPQLDHQHKEREQ